MPPAGAIGVELEQIRRRFGSVSAIDGISLAIEPGAFVALIGPSGCGKTTLLRIVGGLDRPDAGVVRYRRGDGGELAAESALGDASFCFQEPRLLPWRSVLGNVELPLELAGLAKPDRRAAALEAIERMRLGDAADRLPAQLSGGMRMRAAMARALVTKPRLLLLDEPFGALDEVTRHELDEELYRLWSEDRFTALLVTHSIPEAVYLATRAIVMSPRPARVVADEAIELPSHEEIVRVSDSFNERVRSLSAALFGAMRGGAA